MSAQYTLSSLIAELLVIQEAHGDIPVTISAHTFSGGSATNVLDSVEVRGTRDVSVALCGIQDI